MFRPIRMLACALLLMPVAGFAQLLPVAVDVTPDSAAVRIGHPLHPLAEMNLVFDDASGLSAAALGVQAETVMPSAPALLARLPSSLTTVTSKLPVLVTVEPPSLGGLAFQRRVHVDVHTHLLNYSAGSRLRLFKAPLAGEFRDITTSVEPGSVRTRGTTGGFSQFLVLLDTRPTGLVIDEKIAWLRDQLDALPASEAASIEFRLQQVETALAASDYPAAIVAVDRAKARVSSRAGTYIADDWAAGSGLVNSTGELLSGLDTLAFSIGFLRDYGP